MAFSTLSRASRATAKTVGQRTLFLNSATIQPQLEHVMDGVPAMQYFTPVEPVTTTSVLSNGMKVVTVDTPSPVVSMELFVSSSGSRFENDCNAGSSHLLSKLAFQSTNSATSLRVQRNLENAGISSTASVGREGISYSASTLADVADIAVDAIAGSVVNLKIKPHELRQWSKVAEIEASEKTCILDAVHAAAFYDDFSLGRPLYQSKPLTAETIKEFQQETFTPESMTFAAVGMDHESLVSLAETSFSYLKPGNASKAEPAVYEGGEVRLKDNSSATTTVAIAFKGAAAGSQEEAVQLVVANLLGDSAFSFSYSDAGIYGVSSTVNAFSASSAVPDLVASIKSSLSGISTESLTAAKLKAKRSLVSAYESRTGRCSSLAQGVDVKAKVAAIDGVGAAHVKSFITAASKSELTFVASGNLSGVPRIKAVKALF